MRPNAGHDGHKPETMFQFYRQLDAAEGVAWPCVGDSQRNIAVALIISASLECTRVDRTVVQHAAHFLRC